MFSIVKYTLAWLKYKSVACAYMAEWKKIFIVRKRWDALSLVHQPDILFSDVWKQTYLYQLKRNYINCYMVCVDDIHGAYDEQVGVQHLSRCQLHSVSLSSGVNQPSVMLISHTVLDSLYVYTEWSDDNTQSLKGAVSFRLRILFNQGVM